MKFNKLNNSISLPSYAKINLSLDVIGKTMIFGKGNYHNLSMIMQTVSLHDDIYLLKTNTTGVINISCSGSDTASHFIPENEKNTAYKAAKLIFQKFPSQTIGLGLDIKINKRIPIAAGLAGGSSNAAAVIKAMNYLFKLSMSNKQMCSIGLEIGADVPYCLYGGTMLAEGIGEVLTPLPSFPESVFLLVNPGDPLSTAEIFSSIKDISALPHPDTSRLISYLKDQDKIGFMKNTANSLEFPSMNLMPCISKIKDTMIEKSAIGALMTGSGPTVFGLFKDMDSAQNAKEYFSNLNKKYKTFIVTNKSF